MNGDGTRVACLVSGGKDSIAAAYTVHQWGWDVASFLTLLPEAEAPMLYHRPNAPWVRLQAQAVGVPWDTATVGVEEDELAPLHRLLRGREVDGLVLGALASEYQRVRFESAAYAAGLKTFAPLWHHDPVQHLHDVTGMGIQSVLVHVAAAGLDPSWLGRALDHDAAHELESLSAKHRFNVAGEGGEYETFVTDAPFFRRPIEIQRSEVAWSRDAGTYQIRAARLGNRRPP